MHLNVCIPQPFKSQDHLFTCFMWVENNDSMKGVKFPFIITKFLSWWGKMRRSRTSSTSVLILFSVSRACRGLENSIHILHSKLGAPAAKQIRCWKRDVSSSRHCESNALTDRIVVLRGDPLKHALIAASCSSLHPELHNHALHFWLRINRITNMPKLGRL